MKISLLKAIRAVNQVDSLKDRQDFFEQYINRYAIAKAAIGVHKLFRGTLLSPFAYLLFASRYLVKKSYRKSEHFNAVASVDYVNEEHAIESFLAIVNDRLIEDALSDRLAIAGSIIGRVIKNPRDFMRILYFMRNFEKKGTFLTCCRIAELLFLYARASKSLAGSRAAVIASNYSPCACALKAAAEVHSIPVIYTFHSIITTSVRIPALSVDLVVLYGERGLETLRLNGDVRARHIVYAGLPGESYAMKIHTSFNEVQKVGIFLTSFIKDDAFERLLGALSSYDHIKQITVRPHPLKEANPDLTLVSKFSKVIVESRGRASEHARLCDVVIAGSSGAHVDVLKSGVPSLYWEDFDTVGPDYYSLIKYGVAYPLKDPACILWDEIVNFYSEDWIKRFKKFDYSYLTNNDKIKIDVSDAVRALIDHE